MFQISSTKQHDTLAQKICQNLECHPPVKSGKYKILQGLLRRTRNISNCQYCIGNFSSHQNVCFLTGNSQFTPNFLAESISLWQKTSGLRPKSGSQESCGLWFFGVTRPQVTREFTGLTSAVGNMVQTLKPTGWKKMNWEFSWICLMWNLKKTKVSCCCLVDSI